MHEPRRGRAPGRWSATSGRPWRARVLGALAAAAFAVLAGPGLPGPAASLVEAHSQLVSSSPGAGTLVEASPTELRLVFSEPLEARYTAVDITDRYGRGVYLNAGAPDPADPRTFVVPLPEPLPEGIYSMKWHAMSAADGHSTTGFVTFGVGVPVPPTTAGHGSTVGDLHVGHDAPSAALEVAGRVLGYVGFMLAFGLALVAWAVLRPALRGDQPARAGADGPGAPGAGGPGAGRGEPSRPPAPASNRSAAAPRSPAAELPAARRLAAAISSIAVDPAMAPAAAQAVALVLALAGAVILAFAAAAAPDTSITSYLAGTRSGQLLAARIAVAGVGFAVAMALLRLGRTGAATATGGLAGGAGLALMALAGHAEAGSTAAPLVTMLVHLGAAATWLAGVLAMAWFAVAMRGRHLARGRDVLRAAVPRFSALALVSVALVAVTGAVEAWTLTRSLLPFGTPYGLALAAKTLLFVGALGFGAVNFLDGGRGRPTLDDLRRRLIVEAGLAVAVLVAAGNLASGSPPAQERAVAIEPAASSVAATVSIGLDINPGRAGPNQFDVVVPGGLDSLSTVDLVLQRLDGSAGSSRLELRRLAGAALEGLAPGAHFVADGGLLQPDSGWEATAVILGPDGTEVTRQRFAFALDAQAITEGRATPPIDPVLVLAAVLLALGLVGVAFALGGGSLPRAHAATGRRAILASGAVAGALGVLLLAVGVGP